MEIILALLIGIPFLLFFVALGKGVEEGVLRHYEDRDIVVINYYIEDDEEEEEEEYEEEEEEHKNNETK